MKENSQNLLSKLVLTPFAGAISVVPCFLLMLLFAWMFSANYDYLVQPLAAFYGATLPNICFGHWVAVMVLIGTLKLICARVPKHNPGTKDLDKAITRIGTVFTYCILPYLINWIFL